MAKTSRKRSPATEAKTVTAERAARLYKLLKIVSAAPQTREALTRRLKLDVRGFYRDLELLRACDIELNLERKRYSLDEDVRTALLRLPFPDPHLTLGEAELLAKGRSPVHRKLKEQIREIVK